MSINVLKLADELRTEADAYEFLERVRWGDRPVCPHCGSVRKPYFLKPANGSTRKTSRGSASERRVSLRPLTPEQALRALLEVDPEDEPVVASALKRIRTAIPEELATPERHDALIQDALEAGATWEQIDEALNAPR